MSGGTTIFPDHPTYGSFKYSFQRADFLSSFNNREIWMSDPMGFNDPLDFKSNIDTSNYKNYPFDNIDKYKKIIKILYTNPTHFPDSSVLNQSLIDSLLMWADGNNLGLYLNSDASLDFLKDILKANLARSGVMCLTSSMQNTLMWSHYADSHRGYCVEYEVSAIDIAMNGGKIYAYDVQYSSKIGNIPIFDFFISPYEATKRYYSTKSIDWAYEDEIRLIHLDTKGAKVPMPSSMNARALIAGCQMTQANKRILKDKADSLGIDAYEMTLDAQRGFVKKSMSS